MSYIDLEEAEERIIELIISTDRTAWNDLEDDDKTALLNEAIGKLEALHFRGGRCSPEFPDIFPRIDRYGGYDWIEDEGYVVPQAVKDALILEAVAILARGQDSGLEDLQARGVKSVCQGTGLQYEFSGAGGRINGEFVSARAYNLLRQYLATEAVSL